jgi:DNA topoisomerase-1
LRIVCDRELEIEKFVAREYWSIIAHLLTEAKAPFTARLVGADGKKINRLDIGSGAEAEAFKAALEQALFSVEAIESKPVKRHPYPPFTTSTLQQEASRKLGLAPARTMQIAQRLYEGVDVGDGAAGLITYMRTDGVDLAPEAVASARRVIAKDFGENYVPSAPRKYTAKAKNAQEAHEAIRPTDMTKRPRDVARHLEPEQAKLYELIWTRTIACQMESAELERTTVDILAQAGARKLEFRATGQVVRFAGFLALYQEGRDDEEDEESSRLPAMRQGEKLAKERIDASQHFTEPPPRYTEATLVKRMEELGIGRPSTYASTIAVLKDRDYVRLDKKRLYPEDKGRIVTAFLESFFAKYVGYDFTADLEEKLDKVSNSEIDWKALLRDFWNDFSAAIGGIKDLGTRQVLDSLNDLLGPHIFPARGDGVDPRQCPLCGEGQLSLKLGKFGAFIGCSRYPECKFSRVLAPSGAESSEGDRPGVRVLGQDPSTGEEITLRNGRFGEYIQQGEGEKPKRSSLPKGLSADDVTLEKALALLALPREVARHPTSGEAILAGIGRYGAYVQHGKTYANLGRDDDVLEIGGNRAIDLIVAKESGAGGSRFGAGAGRELGEHPEGGKVSVKSGRFGSYVNHGKINATIAKGTDPASLTLDAAVELLKAKAAGGGVIGRLVGEHPDGGPVTVRDGRYGAYVNWGKVNATISKGTTPDSITLSDALELIAEREGQPVAQPRKASKSAPARGKAQRAKPPTKAVVAAESSGARPKSTGTKKAAAKKAAPAKPKSAAGKRG